MPPTTAPTIVATPISDAPKNGRKKRGGRRTPIKGAEPPAAPVQQPRKPRREPRRAQPAKRPRSNPARRAKRPSRGSFDLSFAIQLIGTGIRVEDEKPIADISMILRELPAADRARILAALSLLFR